jgi:hypothetical protein
MKHLRSKGLIGLYKRRRGRGFWRFRWFVHRLFALPFAPPHKVKRVYRQLRLVIKDLIRTNTKVRAFVVYFETYWLFRPSLPVNVWNVYNVLSHRTNNNIEGTHRRFLTIFGVKANLWHFIELLQQYEHAKMLEEGRHRQGRPPTKRKKYYRDQEARLATLKALYQLSSKSVEDTVNFVGSVSHLFRRWLK